MKILAIDTATEQCSVAIVNGEQALARVTPTARSHADMILPMVDEILCEASLTLSDLDVLAFGRGPGSFTGVRIAVSVVQGLAYAVSKPVIGISNLAALAQQATDAQRLDVGRVVLVCADARMQEVYWAKYRVESDGVVLFGAEHVSAPESVDVASDVTAELGVGTGWRAYPVLRARHALLPICDDLLPRAQEIAWLAQREWRAGKVVSAAEAEPVYLRDNVVTVK